MFFLERLLGMSFSLHHDLSSWVTSLSTYTCWNSAHNFTKEKRETFPGYMCASHQSPFLHKSWQTSSLAASMFSLPILPLCHSSIIPSPPCPNATNAPMDPDPRGCSPVSLTQHLHRIPCGWWHSSSWNTVNCWCFSSAYFSSVSWLGHSP